MQKILPYPTPQPLSLIKEREGLGGRDTGDATLELVEKNLLMHMLAESANTPLSLFKIELLYLLL